MAKKPTEKVLSVDVLVLDAGTQSRIALSEETVEEYIEVLEANGKQWPFPPIDVFADGNRYIVASGFHRTMAARRHGRASVPCNVHVGTAWDALVYGMKSNNEHGLRPTRADRRHNVELLLDDGKGLTRQEIAAITGVTERTVYTIVADRKAASMKISGCGSTGTSVAAKDAGDPFGDDEFTESGGKAAAERPTEAAGHEGDQELPPRASGNDKEDSGGGSSRDPLAIQRSRTIKTAEALLRAFGDLNGIRGRVGDYETARNACRGLIEQAKRWK